MSFLLIKPPISINPDTPNSSQHLRDLTCDALVNTKTSLRIFKLKFEGFATSQDWDYWHSILIRTESFPETRFFSHINVISRQTSRSAGPAISIRSRGRNDSRTGSPSRTACLLSTALSGVLQHSSLKLKNKNKPKAYSLFLSFLFLSLSFWLWFIMQRDQQFTSEGFQSAAEESESQCWYSLSQTYSTRVKINQKANLRYLKCYDSQSNNTADNIQT